LALLQRIENSQGRSAKKSAWKDSVYEHGHAAEFASRGAPQDRSSLEWQWARSLELQCKQAYGCQFAREWRKCGERLDRK